jgi:hypothetical protein
LDVGDHPFVKHSSFVFYAEALILKATSIQNGFNKGVLQPRPDLKDAVFDRVVAGIGISPDVPRNIVKYFSQL